MKRLLLATSLALMMLSSTAVLAAPGHGGHGDHGRSSHDDWRHGNDHRWRGAHDNGRHVGEYRRFRRGERVPVIYMQPRYYVNDWRAYHLAPPPRGYRWVRPVDGHFLLVAATTGLIYEMLGY
ncbi:RcnB family protein [Cognatiluteimonas telluris]|jgi:Ni/Co efflux regulator RcnB|uniref:RcnB family protein n=1 Tax=Cognatiluteimonas telluris TaxID=1104775 RepID=UPI001FAF844E|nr:RcnB family protein [Lysobacter telluris]